MTPKLILTYFDGPGRGEPIRLAFKIGNVDFEDKQISFGEWPAIKPTTPAGQVPMLEVDGKKYCESLAILMYACRLGKLVPKDDLANLRNSMICHASQSFWPPLVAVIFASDEEKPALLKKANEDLLPPVYSNLERMVKEAQHATGLICCDHPVAADLVIFSLAEAAISGRYGINLPAFANEYPSLAKVHKVVSEMPAVKAHFGKN